MFEKQTDESGDGSATPLVAGRNARSGAGIGTSWPAVYGRKVKLRFISAIFFGLLASLVVLTGCGGGSSSPPPPPPPPPQITSVSVTPTSASLVPSQIQPFTAQIQGTGSFSSAVTWTVNGVMGGNSTYGTITASGQYTAPTTIPSPANVTIAATSTEDATKSGNSTATIIVPAVLNSISPASGSAGETLTVDATFNLNLIETPQLVFSGTNGTISAELQTANGGTVQVPFGATDGPVYISVPPQPGGDIPIAETSNSVQFTRLPNLEVRAAKKDLSSGETLQLDWRLLGASTPSVVTWKADSGAVNSEGLFQAPTVTTEAYSHVTGCLANTKSCNTVLLRILPFRIAPSNPIVNIGSTLQLSAVQGGSLLSPQWSIVAGGGSITPGGLFTAPASQAESGPVTVSATVGSTTEQTSIAVSGAYAGQVNRVYDYADFTKYTPPESASTISVAVSGNRAYGITVGDPFSGIPLYEALNVYDITDPDQPVWIDAVESPTNSAATLFTYGSTLFSLDSNYLVVYSLQTPLPTVTQILPVTSPFQWAQNGPLLYVIPYTNPNSVSPTQPIDVYDVSTGTAVHSHYELPGVSGLSDGGFGGISGDGNIVYLCYEEDTNNSISFIIATYDISQSPPLLLGTVGSTTATAYHVQVVGNLLFADSQVYDISNVTPVLLATLPLQLLKVWDVQGNYVLAGGGTEFDGTPTFVVVDISSPSNPVVHANVSDFMSWDIFSPFEAAWASNGRFYVNDGTGGLAVFDASPSGGPKLLTGAVVFPYIYDQALQQQTLYEAAVYGSGAGGLACFDVSGNTPSLLGTLMYPNDSSFAVQASGTTVYVGLADSLKVMDASNPQSPSEIASVAIPVNALALSGNTLFAGTGDGRLVVFDVSIPASPKQIGSTTMPAPNTIRLSGTLLLVAAQQSGFLVYDVSNPTAPSMLSQFTPGVSAPIWDVAPIGNGVVMLAADASGIVTVDISSPSQPKQLYQAPLPYVQAFPPNDLAQTEIVTAFSLTTQNGLTYVGTTNSTVFAYDASVPAVPRLMAMNVVATSVLNEGDAQGYVTAISPGTNTLYLAVEGGVVAMDNSIPENSIELYYPPAALEYPVPMAAAMRARRDANPKKIWMGRPSTKQAGKASPAWVHPY